MRRFNLMKPANAGEADDQAPPEPTAPHPSRRRILLLLLLLVVVVALGARNFIGTYIGRESDTPPPTPGRTVIPLPEQAPRPTPAPSMPSVAVIPERSAKASDSDAAPQSKRTVASPPEKNAEPEPSQPRAVQPPEAVEPVGPKATSQGGFSVQVGAMARERNALALRQRLQKLGYPVMIRKAHTPTTQHVVLVTAASDRTEADALVEKLRAEGVSAVMGESDGRYRVEAGRSTELDQAIDLAHELQKKGFTPKIVSESGSSTLYLVRVGQFSNRGEANHKAKELREKGFPTLIVKK